MAKGGQGGSETGGIRANMFPTRSAYGADTPIPAAPLVDPQVRADAVAARLAAARSGSGQSGPINGVAGGISAAPVARQEVQGTRRGK